MAPGRDQTRSDSARKRQRYGRWSRGVQHLGPAQPLQSPPSAGGYRRVPSDILGPRDLTSPPRVFLVSLQRLSIGLSLRRLGPVCIFKLVSAPRESRRPELSLQLTVSAFPRTAGKDHVPEVLQVDTQRDRQQEHQGKLLKQAALPDKKKLTPREHSEGNTVEKNTCPDTNVVPSNQQVPKCESCGSTLPRNVDITPNAYLARRRFEYDGQGNLFLYSKLETPHSEGQPRECNQCRKALSSDQALDANQGTNSKPHKCTKCGRGFSHKSELIAHQRVHRDEKPDGCDEQGNSLREGRVSLNRGRGGHTEEKPGGTSKGGKKLPQKTSLSLPEAVLAGEKPYKCSECEKIFSHKSRLIEHHRSHTGEKPYGCKECGKSFSRKSCLIIHHRIHTGEKPYGCSECGKAFFQKSHLILHRRTHTGEKPYACSECGKAFSQNSCLIIHRRTHLGKKPYECSDCGKTFSQKANLIRHHRIHTREKLYG
ncbi:zinc finger protein OZF [Camelus ferus]|uniref:Zinc finger protein OZF n=1 Tax=Camelus ferus TaxID=419612 RepID=A0A8B8RG56_CAMFR|nr:zinc finger protein OZF [Camelus ferus]